MEQMFPPYMLFSGVLCEMCSYQHALFVCVSKGLIVVRVLVLLSTTILYWFLFSFGMLLFRFEFGWCC